MEIRVASEDINKVGVVDVTILLILSTLLMMDTASTKAEIIEETSKARVDHDALSDSASEKEIPINDPQTWVEPNVLTNSALGMESKTPSKMDNIILLVESSQDMPNAQEQRDNTPDIESDTAKPFGFLFQKTKSVPDAFVFCLIGKILKLVDKMQQISIR